MSFSSSTNRNRRGLRHRKTRTLQCESLEMRQLLSASSSLDGHTLTIRADSRGGEVEVSQAGSSLTVTSTTGGTTRISRYSVSAVDQINFFGSNKRDVFENNTSKRSNIYGQDGDDVLTGGSQRDIIVGGHGNDRIYGRGGHDTLSGDLFGLGVAGGTGNDTVEGGSGNDYIHGGGGNDTLRGGDGDDQLWGWGGNDRLEGNDGNDILRGLNGDDGLIGGSGNDVLQGGAGNDSLSAGWGHDRLEGGDGNDRLKGANGNDILEGGNGNDIYFFDVDSSLGSDVLNEPLGLGANGGTDTLDFSRGDGGVTVNLGATGLQRVHANLNLTLGSGVVENVTGGNGNDVIRGSWHSNRLDGGNGNDLIEGGWGNDYLLGQAGNDSLHGGTGNDILVGSAGDDRLWGDQGQDILSGSSGYDISYRSNGDYDVDGYTFSVERRETIADTSTRVEVYERGRLIAVERASDRRIASSYPAYRGRADQIVIHGVEGTEITLFNDSSYGQAENYMTIVKKHDRPIRILLANEFSNPGAAVGQNFRGETNDYFYYFARTESDTSIDNLSSVRMNYSIVAEVVETRIPRVEFFEGDPQWSFPVAVAYGSTPRLSDSWSHYDGRATHARVVVHQPGYSITLFDNHSYGDNENALTVTPTRAGVPVTVRLDENFRSPGAYGTFDGERTDYHWRLFHNEQDFWRTDSSNMRVDNVSSVRFDYALPAGGGSSTPNSWWVNTTGEAWAPLNGGPQQFRITIPRVNSSTTLLKVVNTTGSDLQLLTDNGQPGVVWRAGEELQGNRYRNVTMDHVIRDLGLRP